MASAGPHAIGIRAARTDRETVSSHAGKQREAAAMMRTEQELRNSNMSTKNLAPRLADFSVTIESRSCASPTPIVRVTSPIPCLPSAARTRAWIFSATRIECRPAQPPVRHRQARAGVPGGDALARHGRDRHTRRTYRTILSHARAGPIRRASATSPLPSPSWR